MLTSVDVTLINKSSISVGEWVSYKVIRPIMKGGITSVIESLITTFARLKQFGSTLNFFQSYFNI